MLPPDLRHTEIRVGAFRYPRLRAHYRHVILPRELCELMLGVHGCFQDHSCRSDHTEVGWHGI